MIYPIVPFPLTLSDLSPRFQGYGAIFMPICLSVFCAQLTRDLLAIAKFLYLIYLLLNSCDGKDAKRVFLGRGPRLLVTSKRAGCVV